MGTSGPGSDIYRLEVKVIDTKTLGEKYYLISPIKEITDILIKVKELPLENVKCVLFQFMNDDVKKETKIAKLLESYYKHCNIRLFCCSANSIFCSTILDIAEEFGVEDSQSLVFIRGDQVRCITIKRENDNFLISADNCFNAIFFFEFMDPAILEKQYITESKIFVYFHRDEPSQKCPDELQMKTFKQVSSYMKTKTFLILNKDPKDFSNKAIIAKVLHFLGEASVSKYNVACLTYTYFGLVPWEDRNIIAIGDMELLPVKKTFVCYEHFKNLMCIDFQGYQFEGFPELSVNETGTAVTFSIDRFLSPNITLHQPEKVVDNVVIIHFKEDKFSLEVIKNGILEVIGLEIPMMISFANDKVLVGEEALKMKENYNTFVVSDLLKLLSSDFKINESNPEWGFKVIKNKENENLVVFQTFRGQRKTTPLFLLSILMKWAVTKAEVKLEKLPDTVVIVIKPLYYDLKQILINACNGTKGKFNDIQIHKNKIVQIKEA